MSAKVTMPAPDFAATALVGEEFKNIKLSDYKGKYVLLYFYPLDFTFVCPTEIIAFDEKLAEFKKRNTEGMAFIASAQEIAPAMGMIGTLVGLVLMLGNMSDPKSIGPSMAVALLTKLS